VATHAEIEAPKAITRKTVATTLKNNGLWTVPLHHALNNGFKDALVRDIINTVTEGEVDSIVFTLSDTNISQFTCTGEVLSILVERDSHHTVCGIERFFNTITVMNIYINI
jgi:hypothetical protein